LGEEGSFHYVVDRGVEASPQDGNNAASIGEEGKVDCQKLWTANHLYRTPTKE
jgi:hypothetical protein